MPPVGAAGTAVEVEPKAEACGCDIALVLAAGCPNALVEPKAEPPDVPAAG